MTVKKIALLIALATNICIFSQTEKGKFLIGAQTNLNLNFDFKTAKGDNFSRDAGSETSFFIAPSVGYAIQKNLFLGLSTTYNYLHDDDKEFSSEAFINIFSASPFVKLYFSDKKIKPFLLGSFGFGVQKIRSKAFGANNFRTSSTNFNVLNLGGGITYFFNKNVNMELGLNYSRLANDSFLFDEETYVTQRFNTSIGFYIFL